MNDNRASVVVIPCSRIGKSLGTVTREVAYELCENLRPHNTHLVALSKLVLGEEQTREQVRSSPAVTIDGCKQMCAAKLVKQSGGAIAHEVAVFDAFRRHKDLKPEGIAELNAAGKELARVLAEEIAGFIDTMDSCESEPGGHHA